MPENNVKLSVQDLSVSFRTNQGMVRAVRNISFDLYEGETLAIVGESGSGKSVSSRTIMGILAGNGIIDDGKIIYEAQDLTKINEENFHLIRGDKIGMIFQDPLSSLNPIMKIGKQITEGMLINGKRLKQKKKRLVHRTKMEVYNSKERYHDLKAAYKKEKEAIKNEESDKTLAQLNEAYAPKFTEAGKAIKTAAKEYKKLKPQARKTVNKEWSDKKAEGRKKIAELKQKLANAGGGKEALAREKAAIQKDIDKQKAAFDEFKQKWQERLNKDIAGKIKKDQAEIRKLYRKELREEEQKTNKKIAELKAKQKNIGGREDIKKEIEAVKEETRRFKKVTRKEATERAITVMDEVGIPEPRKRLRQYPFQFSGGMRQRIVIAIALTANPDLLICDEPTTALDVTIQAQILELIKNLKEERNLSVIFITHDLGVVANMADRVAVMYAGQIVEIGTADEIFYTPKHPYTWALLSSMPDLASTGRLMAIPGTPPNMLFPPKGDAFAERSQYAMKIDFEQEPPFFKVSDTHYAKTWLLHKDAPKVQMPEVIQNRIDMMKEANNSAKEVKTDG